MGGPRQHRGHSDGGDQSGAAEQLAPARRKREHSLFALTMFPHLSFLRLGYTLPELSNGLFNLGRCIPAIVEIGFFRHGVSLSDRFHWASPESRNIPINAKVFIWPGFSARIIGELANKLHRFLI